MRLAGVDLNLLVTLDALLSESSVTRAADRLGLSVPAVSHALGRLREQLDDPVLVRAGRGMVKTARAKRLEPEVRQLVAAAERVLAPDPARDLSRVERTFTIHATDYVLHVMGREVDRSVGDAAPRIALRYRLNEPDDGEKLRAGDADLAVGVYGKLPPEVRIRKLFEERLVTVVRAGHPVVKRRLSIEQYARLPHIQVAPRGRPGGLVDRRLSDRGRSRRVLRIVPFFSSAVELVAQSDYLLTLPERIARHYADRFDLRVHETPLALSPYTLQLIWHPRHDGDEVHAWLRSVFVQASASLDRTEPDKRDEPDVRRCRPRR